jgi:ssDNA-binding Zn-finger/Zn-ribbon topoisomerase 1
LCKKYPKSEYTWGDGGKATYDSCTAFDPDISQCFTEVKEIDEDTSLIEIKCPKCGQLNKIRV